MRVGATEFVPLMGADPMTPIYELVCARRWCRPWQVAHLELPGVGEMAELGVRMDDPAGHVLWHLWDSPSVPVCGAVYRLCGTIEAVHASGGMVVEPQPDRHVCLLPPEHRIESHYAPGRYGGFTWPRRRYMNEAGHTWVE